MTENDDTGEANTGALTRPILIPLDGTDVSGGILPYVCQIARSTNVPLILHGVVDPHAIEYPVSMGPHVIYKDQIEGSAMAHISQWLRSIAARLENEGVEAQIKITLGRPADEILRVAAEDRCSLIAMSTHGRNVIGRAILGSVTDKVIRTSTVPVLTIAPEKAKAYQAQDGVPLKRVMLPLDGSELAEQAAPYVESLARSLSLKVLLVRVVDLEYPLYAYPAGEQLARLTEGRLSEASRYLDRVSRDLKSRGLTVETTVLRGSPAQALLDLAHRTQSDLIAMTTHGRSGLSRWLTGSVADALVRASGDPVLVIRPNLDRQSEQRGENK